MSISLKSRTVADGTKDLKDHYSVSLLKSVKGDLDSYDVDYIQVHFSNFKTRRAHEIKHLKLIDTPSSVGVRKVIRFVILRSGVDASRPLTVGAFFCQKIIFLSHFLIIFHIIYMKDHPSIYFFFLKFCSCLLKQNTKCRSGYPGRHFAFL